MVRRTKQEALETRAQLLDAAEAVFSEKGVTNTSLLEIAQRAGLTRGAIYHHFEDKYALIDALMQRLELPFEDFRRELKQELARDPLAQIEQTTREVLRRVTQDPHWLAIYTILFLKCEYVGEAEQLRRHHVESRNQCLQEVTALIAEAIAQKQLAATRDPRTTAFAIFSFVDGLIYHWLLETECFDLAAHSDTLIGDFFNCLRKA